MRDHDIIHANDDCSAASERAAHQLAALAQAYNNLAQLGPGAMREGAAILDECADQLRRLAKRAATEPKTRK